MRSITVAVIAVAMLGGGAAHSQEPAKQQQPMAPMAAEEHEGPHLGEIMSVQQMRHIKLWFAGRNENWPLADYELGELGEGFEDITKLIGGDTIEKAVGGAMTALQKAVEDKNRAAFTAAYDNLSAGCNGCHQTLEHGFIVIQRPSLLPYSDQSFKPQK